MANRMKWVISLGHSAWQLFRIRSGEAESVAQRARETADVNELANAIGNAMVEAGYRSGQPVMLALGATDCLTASVQIPSARHGRNRDAMTYLMEPMIPWSAEDTVVDYERTDGHALMVAARIDVLDDMMAVWEEHGIRITSIVPRARLMVESRLRHGSMPLERHLVLIADAHAVDLWVVDGRNPLEWQHLSIEDSEVTAAVRLRLMSEAIPLSVVCCGLADTVINSLEQIGDLNLQCIDAGPEESSPPWVGYAERILDGSDVPPLELLRQPLRHADQRATSSASADWLLASVMILLVCVGAAFLMKAEQANTRRESMSEDQKTVFRDVLPNQRVGQAVRSRLESELRRLQGMSGEGADVPEVISAAEVLNRLLKSLPNDMRFQLLDIRIEDGRLALDGHVRNHSNADTIAAALRTAGAVVASPQSNRLPNGERGVGFRISAELPKTTAAGEESS